MYIEIPHCQLYAFIDFSVKKNCYRIFGSFSFLLPGMHPKNDHIIARNADDMSTGDRFAFPTNIPIGMESLV